ncbi:MAG: TRAP transporter small permease [Synergistaceae bacterium]|nr:TRAP transporter small permease [Synergistaceae bacterium]
MKKWIPFLDSISLYLGRIGGLCLVVGCVMIIGEIVNRSFFHGTFYVVDEYTGYLMGVSSFLGLAYAEQHNGHIRMELIDYVQGRYPGLVRTIKSVCYLLAILFALYLTYVTYQLFHSSYVSGQRSYQVSETLLAIPQAFLPLGSFALFLQYVVNFIKFRQKEATA